MGGVAEWLNAPVLKTGMGESPSWVRIPPPPPLTNYLIVNNTSILMIYSTLPTYPQKKVFTYAYSGKTEADEKTLAARMLLETWRNEAEEQMLDHYHWIKNTGCLG